MRLIDADVLIEEIKNMSQRYCDCKDCDGRGQIIRVSEVIDIAKNEAPTAYDIDKVVEELRENASRYTKKYTTPYGNNGYKDTKAISIRKAIEIVKQGGVIEAEQKLREMESD